MGASVTALEVNWEQQWLGNEMLGLNSEVTATVGKAEATANIGAQIFGEDGKLDVQLGATVGNLTSQMTQMVEGLASTWEGEAATAYITKFRQLDDDIQKMIRMIQEHSNDLNDMARVYRDAETANTDEIAGLAGDVII